MLKSCLKLLLFQHVIITSLSQQFVYGPEQKSGEINVEAERSFEIDYENNGFRKDGKPFRYIAGSVHYFRIHPDDWRDRIRKLKYAGCNALQTYVEWSSHEPEQGEYDFEGGNDFLKFLNMTHEEGLLVILRPGPYINAERDKGGLPYWLLRENPEMKLRTNDQSYLYYVDRWFGILFPLLRPFLYENGGPIITIQIENEYGSLPYCDFHYTSHLRDLTRSLLGSNIVLFTTDGHTTHQLKCGKVADVYATVDFGTEQNVTEAFAAQRIFEPRGPLINSEFYPGWLDYWGHPHSKRSIKSVTTVLDEMLALNASISIYVFQGGSAFGMKAASNIEERFKSCTTSYDFDAPVTEGGDPTKKYFAIRNVIKKYLPVPSGAPPGPAPKQAYGDVPLTLKAGLLEVKEVLKSVKNKWPLTFEELSVFNGIVIYSTKIPYRIPDPARLNLYDIHDRGYVFVDKTFAGIVSREQDMYELSISAAPHQELIVVVESQGRVASKYLDDFKGITTNVTIGTEMISDWEMTAVPLLNSTKLRQAFNQLGKMRFRQLFYERMKFYEGSFDVPFEAAQPKATFLRLDGWTKGYAWVNDFLLGRYWPVVGPQVTLFVPHGVLQLGSNSLLVLELEDAPCSTSASCKVTLVDTPEIDGPTPRW